MTQGSGSLAALPVKQDAPSPAVFAFGTHLTPRCWNVMKDRNRHRDEQIDAALEESFPASDPPYFVGSGAGPGTETKPRRKPGEFYEDFGRPPHLASRH